MERASINGIEVAFDDTGGDGPAVVLGHGFAMDRSMFDSQVEALRSRYRVITWDERGHGDTVYPPAPFTYWDLADDCLGLLDHLGLDRAVVGGMSQGGFIALRLALTAPERVRGLILLDTQAGSELPELIPLYQAMVDQWLEQGPTDELVDATAGLIIGQPDLNRVWTERWRAREKEDIRYPGRALLTRDDITDRLGEITAPALVVHGTADASIGMDRAEVLAAGLPGCPGVVVIEGGTHSANMTHPGPVNRAILDFLDGLPA
jgi:pimeloyl-ACP methyl ester carboxylesterase